MSNKEYDMFDITKITYKDIWKYLKIMFIAFGLVFLMLLFLANNAASGLKEINKAERIVCFHSSGRSQSVYFVSDMKDLIKSKRDDQMFYRMTKDLKKKIDLRTCVDINVLSENLQKIYSKKGV